MKSSTRRIAMVIAGIWLVYTGADLIRAVIASSQKDKWLFLAFAILFLVFGATVILMNVRAMIRDYRETPAQPDKEVEEKNEAETDRRLLPEEKEIHTEETKTKKGEEDSHCG